MTEQRWELEDGTQFAWVHASAAGEYEMRLVDTMLDGLEWAKGQEAKELLLRVLHNIGVEVAVETDRSPIS